MVETSFWFGFELLEGNHSAVKGYKWIGSRVGEGGMWSVQDVQWHLPFDPNHLGTVENVHYGTVWERRVAGSKGLARNRSPTRRVPS